MKSERPLDHHEAVRKLMQAWTVTAALPPRFKEGVWRRIEAAEFRPSVSLRSMLMDRLTELLPRPAFAVAYVTVLLTLGIVAGHWQARHLTVRVDTELGARYLQSVDPYQKPRL